MSQGLQHEYLLQHAPQWAAVEEPALPHSYAWGISRASCFSHSSLSELLCVIFNSINNYKFCNKHDITEVSTTSVADCFSFGQLWVCFGASWSCSVQHLGRYCSFLTKTTPEISLLPTPCHENPIQITSSGLSHWSYHVPPKLFQESSWKLSE